MANNADFKILSFNLNGMASPPRMKRILTELALSPVDIFFLQETHLKDKSQIEMAQKQWPGLSLWEAGSPSSCGEAILFNKRLTPTLANTHYSGCGRYIATDCVVNKQSLRLLNIYSPTEERPRADFLKTLIPSR